LIFVDHIDTSAISPTGITNILLEKWVKISKKSKTIFFINDCFFCKIFYNLHTLTY